MTTNTTNTASQAPEALTKQVAAWRAEVARLNDLIAHATGSSQAPAASIEDDEQFIDLMHALSSVPSSVYAGSEFSKVINYIDAKLAQAEARATAAEAERDEAKTAAADWKHLSILASRKAREAEQRLRMQERFANRPKTPATADFDLPAPNDALESHPQADESGLPG